MNLKADLKIILMANNVTVAESDDPRLWQQVLATIQSGSQVENQSEHAELPGSVGTNAISKWAGKLGVERDLLVGACSPEVESPYIHLDQYNYEALSKNSPKRGPSAIPPLVLALSLLLLWAKEINLRSLGQNDGQLVLGTIGIRDKNPSRGIKNCEWLQQRGESVIINPAKISYAEAVAKAYCLQEPLSIE